MSKRSHSEQRKIVKNLKRSASKELDREIGRAIRTGKKGRAGVLIALGLALALWGGRSIRPYLEDAAELSAVGSDAGTWTAGTEEGASAGAERGEHGSAGTDAAARISVEVEQAELVRIVDGDTIRVRIDGEGEEQKVRLLEINTPESVHSDERKNNRFGEEASDHLKEMLAGAETVWLTRDQSDTDQYGRLLRLVWTAPPEDPFSEEELRENCVNAMLLLDGYAQVVVYDDDGYEAIFTQFLEEAKREQRGLWADAEWRRFVKK